jgi:hypothetical protein
MDNGQRTIFLLSIVRCSLLNRCFFDDHHRNIVFDRIDKRTFGVDTFQGLAIRFQLDLRLTFRAAENFQQFRFQWHI